MEMEGRSKVVRNAEKLVVTAMAGRDASHDAEHAFRVRDLALSLASEEGLSSDPTSDSDSLEIVELAALLHDIGDYKYMKNSVEDMSIVECFLNEEGLQEGKREKILSIIKGMGFKNEVSQTAPNKFPTEFGVVQDADRLDAIGAIDVEQLGHQLSNLKKAVSAFDGVPSDSQTAPNLIKNTSVLILDLHKTST